MIEIEIAKVLDHLGSDLTRALDDAVRHVMPGVPFERHELYRAFQRAVLKKCSVWERVPDAFVKLPYASIPPRGPFSPG